jgi:hypothetical protein
MKEKVALATIQGKAYFLIVNELKERNIPFISLIPGKHVPAEVKAVITTEKEKPLINHPKILLFKDETDVDSLMSKVVITLQGKEAYEKIIIGIDPGEVFGLAVISDGQVSERANCFSVQEVLSKIQGIIKNINVSTTTITIKIGNGVPAYKELLETLDNALPTEVTLEVVSEAGTNLPLKKNKRSRRLRHIASAIKIAARVGYIYSRRKTSEANS